MLTHEEREDEMAIAALKSLEAEEEAARARRGSMHTDQLTATSTTDAPAPTPVTIEQELKQAQESQLIVARGQRKRWLTKSQAVAELDANAEIYRGALYRDGILDNDAKLMLEATKQVKAKVQQAKPQPNRWIDLGKETASAVQQLQKAARRERAQVARDQSVFQQVGEVYKKHGIGT